MKELRINNRGTQVYNIAGNGIKLSFSMYLYLKIFYNIGYDIFVKRTQ